MAPPQSTLRGWNRDGRPNLGGALGQCPPCGGPELTSEDADLYRAGMNSLSTVNVMLALEEEFSVEFPDHLLQASTFRSVASIRSVLQTLTSPGE